MTIRHNPETGLDCVSAGAVRKRPQLGQMSPRDLRDYKPRLRFNYRCVECGCEFTGAANQGYCCGQYAIDIDEEREAEQEDAE